MGDKPPTPKNTLFSTPSTKVEEPRPLDGSLLPALPQPMNRSVKYSKGYAKTHNHLQVKQPHSTKRGVCGRCGQHYEPYLLLIENSHISIISYKTRNDIYGWWCQQCSKEMNNKRGKDND